MIHDQLPPDHFVEHTYRARCSCGWRSTAYRHREAADAALEWHRTHVEGDRDPAQRRTTT